MGQIFVKKLILGLFLLSSFPIWSIKNTTVFEELSEEEQADTEVFDSLDDKDKAFDAYLEKKIKILKKEYITTTLVTGNEHLTITFVCSKLLLKAIGSDFLDWRCAVMLGCKCLYDLYQMPQEINRLERLRKSLRNKTS